MYRGIVAGTVVATVKDPHLEGVPLLVVRKKSGERCGKGADRGR